MEKGALERLGGGWKDDVSLNNISTQISQIQNWLLHPLSPSTIPLPLFFFFSFPHEPLFLPRVPGYVLLPLFLIHSPPLPFPFTHRLRLLLRPPSQRRPRPSSKTLARLKKTPRSRGIPSKPAQKKKNFFLSAGTAQGVFFFLASFLGTHFP